MNIGVNVGYSAVKAVCGERRVTFPSVVGTPDKAAFSLNGDSALVLVQPAHVLVGDEAVEQSRFIYPREDRAWIESEEWTYLFVTALTELSSTPHDSAVRVVTGLPVAFYSDAEKLAGRLLGDHRVQREGRQAQLFHIADVRVVPEAFGTVFAAAFNDQGKAVDQALLTGTVGVIDLGGKTTNLLSVRRCSQVNRETASVNVGAWAAVRAVQAELAQRFPGLEELRAHQVMDAVIARKVRYYGDDVDLRGIVEDTLRPLAKQVLAEATRLWNGGATLDRILVAGGGALLLGSYIEEHFPHAQVIPDPVFANALGFWRFGQRVWR